MIRVVTYNISGGVDPDAVSAVLAMLEPRIGCILEAPSPRRLRRLARAAGLAVAARAGRSGSATAVLVHPDVHVQTTARVRLTSPRDVPPREVSHAIVSDGGLRLSVHAVQFGLRPDVRRTNLDELSAHLRSVQAPSVVGCDLNETIRSPVAQALARRYQDAHAVAGSGPGETYPTSDPSTRQDFVFVDRSLTVVACHVPTAPPVDVASHHRPVVADVAASEDRDGWLDGDEVEAADEPDASAA